MSKKQREAERIKNESERRVFEDKAINEIAQRELGEWARPEGVIFDWPVEPLPADTKFDSIFYGVDFGFSIDPAAVVKVYRRADYYAELQPVPDVPTASKAQGVTLRDNWSFEIVDESLIPREFLKPDEVKIRSVVIAQKDKTNIPGIKAVNRPIIVKSRGV